MDINPPKCSDIDFINFLIAASNVFSCTEAARCYPFVANAPSHDAFTRCLQRQPPDTEALCDEVKNHVKPEEGFLIVDDSTLDKPYAKEMAFVRRMWSGKHHRTVKGIGLITLIWTDGTTVIPVDFRIYNIDEDDKTKNDHFRDMIDKGEERDFNPEFVLFDTSDLPQMSSKKEHFFCYRFQVITSKSGTIISILTPKNRSEKLSAESQSRKM